MSAALRRLLPSLALLLLAAPPAAAAADRADAQGDPLPDGALARLGTARFRDGNYINLVVVSPDGKVLAVGGGQGVRLLDLVTGKELRALKSPRFGGYNSLAFSPDGKVVAAGEYNGHVQFWDAAKGGALSQIAPETKPGVFRQTSAFTFSGDGKYVALGSSDNFGGNGKSEATVYEVATGKQASQVEVMQNYNIRAVLSGDGKVLATAGQHMMRAPGDNPMKVAENNQTIQLWDAASGKELRKVRDESVNTVAAVAFSPDGKQMAVASGQGGIAVWDPATGKALRRFAGRRNLGSFLAFSPDGKVLAAASLSGAVQTWDAATGKRLGLYEVPRHLASRLAFTAAGKLLACGTTGQAVQVWDVTAEKSLTPTAGHQAAVIGITFTAGGKVVSVAGDGGIITWDAAGKESARVQLRGDDGAGFPVGFGNSFKAMLAPDGKHLFLSDTNGVRLFELAKGREVCSFTTTFAGQGAAALSPDGTLLAVASVSFAAVPGGGPATPLVRLFDVETGGELRKLEGLTTNDVRGLAFSPDGKTLAAAGNKFAAGFTHQVRAWDVATGKERWHAEKPQLSVQGLAYAPDGKSLAALDVAGGVTLYDDAGKEAHQLGGAAAGGLPGVGFNGNAATVAFAPDAHTLAVASYDPNAKQSHVRLYELATGKVRLEFIGHSGPVTAVAFAADGKRMATGSSDTTVLLWDLTGNAGEKEAKGKPDAAELDKLWGALADADAKSGFQAMRRLAQAPEEAVEMLAKYVKAVEGKGSADDTIQKLIAGLDADDFDAREKATKELAGLGAAAREPLRKALKADPSAEAKQRIEQLLAKLADKAGPALDLVRPLRAVEVLEGVGTPEAKKLLQELAKGQAEAPLTEAAKAAVARLEAGAKK